MEQGTSTGICNIRMYVWESLPVVLCVCMRVVRMRVRVPIRYYTWLDGWLSIMHLPVLCDDPPTYLRIVHSTSHVLNIYLLTLLCIDCLCVWHWATFPRCRSWHQLLRVEDPATVLWSGSIPLLCSHNGELKHTCQTSFPSPTPSFLSLFSFLLLSSSPYLHPLPSQFTFILYFCCYS